MVMGRHYDQGLGAAGLILLAVVLSVLLTVGIPIVVSRDAVELKDWLGFAGNVLGAGVALLAAAIAWRAVQSQIAAQQEATLLGVLTREEDRLETELRDLDGYGVFLSNVLTLSKSYASDPAGCITALRNLGLGSSAAKTFELLRRVGGSNFNSVIAIFIEGELSALTDAIGDLANLRSQRNTGLQVPESDFDETKARVESARKRVDERVDLILDRTGEIGRLRSEYRQRIERGLGEIAR
jgi:hypothetical protein